MVIKKLISFTIILLLVSCDEDVAFNENRNDKDKILVKKFNAKSMVTQFRNSDVESSTTDSYIGYRKIKNNAGIDKFNVITRSFYSLILDTSFIQYKEGILQNYIKTAHLQLTISGSDDTEFNKNFNHNVKLRAVFTDFTGENVYLRKNEYWSQNRNIELPEDPDGSVLLDQDNLMTSIDSTRQTFQFEIGKNSFDTFLKSDNNFRFRGFLLESELKEGFLKFDTLPTLKIVYKDSIEKDIAASSAYIWNNYEEIAPSSANDDESFLLGGNRRVAVFKFDTLEINKFTRENIVLGGSFRFKGISSDETDIKIRIRQLDNVTVSEEPLKYNDDHVYQLFGGSFPVDIEHKDDLGQYKNLATKQTAIASILRQYLSLWEANGLVQGGGEAEDGVVFLQQDQNKVPTYIELPKFNEADSLYTLSVYYSPKEVE